VVESTALEMRRTGNCTEGSNPSLSARRKCPAGRWGFLWVTEGRAINTSKLSMLSKIDFPYVSGNKGSGNLESSGDSIGIVD
jgi:hypothetical protein